MASKTRIELYLLFLTLNLLLCFIVPWSDFKSEFESVSWLLAVLIIQSSLQDFFKENYTNGMIEQLLLQGKGVHRLLFKIILDYWGKNGSILAIIAFLVRYFSEGNWESALIFPITFFSFFPILISFSCLSSALALKKRSNLLAPILSIPIMFPLMVFNILFFNHLITANYFILIGSINFLIVPINFYFTYLVLKLNIALD